MAIVHRRKFGDDEKRFIISEAGKRGVNTVLREHNLSYSVFYKWKEKYGIDAGKEVSRAKLLSQIKELTNENDRLRKLIADLAATIQTGKDRERR